MTTTEGGTFEEPAREPEIAAVPMTMEERQTRLEEDMRALTRLQFRIAADSMPPPAPPSRSIAVKAKDAAKEAASRSALATRIGFSILGFSAVIAEWVASYYPKMIGPLGALLKVALRLLPGTDTVPP